MDTGNYIELKRASVFSLKDSSAIFLCCENKTLLVQTEAAFADNAIKAMQGIPNPRPQTYELLSNVCRGFDISLEKVAITHYRSGIYFARLIYSMKNELGTKILEIDSRPSDAILQSFLHHAKVFIAPEVFAASEDATPLLKKIQAREAEKNAS